MLIRSIRAENFMRFSSLRVEGLPETGLIGIEGENESGKTSLGDAILFALFGRTTRRDDAPVTSFIRWNAERMWVEILFSVRERGDLLVYREVERDGTMYVKLLEYDKRRELAVGHADVARALERLAGFDLYEFRNFFFLDQFQAVLTDEADPQLLDRLTGHAYTAAASAELAKEIEHREREHSHYARDIERNSQQIGRYDAGISRLDDLARDLETIDAELETESLKRSDLEAAVKALKRFGDDLGRFVSRIEAASGQALREAHRTLKGAAKRYQDVGGGEPERRGKAIEAEFAAANREAFTSQSKSCAELHALLNAFVELRRGLLRRGETVAERLALEGEESWPARVRRAQEELEARRRSCRRQAIWCVLLLLPALAGAVAVGFSWLAPSRFEWALDLLPGGGSPGEKTTVLRISLAVVAACFGTGFAGAALARAIGAAAQRKTEGALGRLEAELRSFQEERDAIRAACAEDATSELGGLARAGEATCDRELGAATAAFLERFQAYLASGDEGVRRAFLDLAAAQRSLRDVVRKEWQRLDKVAKELASDTKRHRSERNRIENEIREAQASRPKRDQLRARNSELEARARELRDHVDVRRCAIELLAETSQGIRRRLGPTMTEAVRAILPRLTGGRYRDVKVGDDLTVKLFATEKNDFMELSELSGGTLESLKFALRLATAQTLAMSRGAGAQFVFLDEPLKMADERRALAVFDAIRDLRGEVRQIFVVQQEFSEAQRRALDWAVQTTLEASELTVGESTEETSEPAPPLDGCAEELVASRVDSVAEPAGDDADRSSDGEVARDDVTAASEGFVSHPRPRPRPRPPVDPHEQSDGGERGLTSLLRSQD